MKRKSLIMGVAVWILSVTSIFSSGKINVKAEEKIQEQNAFKWEVSDSYSKTIAQEDYDVINTYYGAYSYCPDKVVFFKDSKVCMFTIIFMITRYPVCSISTLHIFEFF